MLGSSGHVQLNAVNVNWYTFMFSAIVSKGNDFCDILVASLDDETFPKGVYS